MALEKLHFNGEVEQIIRDKTNYNDFETKVNKRKFDVVIDMISFNDIAMSQFSYGKLEDSSRNDKELPLVSGFDKNGNLTKDPNAILKTKGPLPIGNWKGSGLSLLLDLIAMILSGGKTSYEIGKFEIEHDLS